jgi:hypothetical protein
LKAPKVPLHLLGLALFLAISPLAYVFVIELALKRDALQYQNYLEILWVANRLEAPGMLVARLFWYEPLFWVEHSRGAVYWGNLTGFLACNLVGWGLLLTLIRAAFRALILKLRSARNTHLNGAATAREKLGPSKLSAPRPRRFKWF